MKRDENPYTSAGFISQLSYWYLNPLMKLGYQRALEHSDLHEIPEDSKASYLSEYFERHWNREVKSRGPKANLFRAFHHAFGRQFYRAIAWKLVNDSLMFVGPMVVLGLVNFLQNPLSPIYVGILLSFVLIASGIMQGVALAAYFKQCYVVSAAFKIALSAAVYKKSLRLSNASRQQSTVGEIVNLMSVDSRRIQEFLPYVHTLWSSPLQILISLIILYDLLGWPVFVGVATMILLIPVSTKVSQAQSKFEEAVMKIKDERTKTMSEVLQGMRIIKFFAWENAYLQRIIGIRRRELFVLRKAAFANVVSDFLWIASPIFVTATTYSLFSVSSRALSVGAVFASLTLFNGLKFPLSVIAPVIQGAVQARVSADRITKFLLADELDGIKYITSRSERPTSKTTGKKKKNILLDDSTEELDGMEEIAIDSHDQIDFNTISQALSLTPSSSSSDIAIQVIGGNFHWDVPPQKESTDKIDGSSVSRGVTLKNIDFAVRRGELALVVGSVGAGKSSLLSALLGELKTISGTVRIDGTVAYVAQTPWIVNASLKDNILMGKKFDAVMYQQVLEACALSQDIAVLPAGDATEIGEKGVNLSGGQKQRVSLARALYYDADTYLFDDSLSAVDVHVGQHILKEMIVGKLKDRTRVLVTHQQYALPHASVVAVMREGEIVRFGTYDQVMEDAEALGLIRTSIESSASSPSSDAGSSQSKEQEPSKAAASGKDKEGQSKLVTEEERARGSVDRGIYLAYIKRARMWAPVLVVAIGLATNSMGIGANWWLAKWTQESKLPSPPHPLSYYLPTYVAIAIVTAILVLIQSGLAAVGGLYAATDFHDSTLIRVFGSPLSFFDRTPVGRVLNLFSQDQDSLDWGLPTSLFELCNCSLIVLFTIILVAVASPLFLVAIVPIGILYHLIQRYYVSSCREIRRLISISTSPIFSHFTETLQGVATIRAFDFVDSYTDLLYRKLDYNNQAFYAFFLSNRWLSVRLEACASLVVFSAALFSVVFRRYTDPTLAGLALSYALAVTGALNWMVRTVSDTESKMNSVERMIQYQSLPQEEDVGRNDIDIKIDPVDDWPRHGGIRFNNVSMRYREGLPLVLKGFDLAVPPRTKVGICGRTGSGKSSLMLCLFRLVEISEGSILIDDTDIKSMTHRALRSRMAIIPQDPVLFTGTIESNLDPFNEHSQEEKWAVLKRAGIDDSIGRTCSSGLKSSISENGENFSVGERQLLCLARALLRKSKIIVLDEATAAVDHQTDTLIQATLRKECADCTVLTIAHRLHTILDYDVIALLDDGRLIEVGPPQELIQRGGVFAEMVDHSKA